MKLVPVGSSRPAYFRTNNGNDNDNESDNENNNQHDVCC